MVSQSVQDGGKLARESREPTLVAEVGGLEARIPLWEARAFGRWLNPSESREGSDSFVGRPLRAPGA